MEKPSYTGEGRVLPKVDPTSNNQKGTMGDDIQKLIDDIAQLKLRCTQLEDRLTQLEDSCTQLRDEVKILKETKPFLSESDRLERIRFRLNHEHIKQYKKEASATEATAQDSGRGVQAVCGQCATDE